MSIGFLSCVFVKTNNAKGNFKKFSQNIEKHLTTPKLYGNIILQHSAEGAHALTIDIIVLYKPLLAARASVWALLLFVSDHNTALFIISYKFNAPLCQIFLSLTD